MTTSLDKDSTPKRKMYYVTSGQLDHLAAAAPDVRYNTAEQVRDLQELGPEQMESIFPPSPTPASPPFSQIPLPSPDDNFFITRGELHDLLAYRTSNAENPESPEQADQIANRILRRGELKFSAEPLTDEELQAEINRRTHALSIRLGVDLPPADTTSWRVTPGPIFSLPEPQPMQVELTPAALQGIADAIREGMVEAFIWKMQ
jgi:hypothetical protein